MDKLFGAFVIGFIILFFGGMGWSIYKHTQYENSLVVVKREIRTLTITHVNHPKHFDVNGFDNTGAEWVAIGNSKHCNGSHQRVKKGQQYPMTVTTYRDLEGRVFSRLNDYELNRRLCGR